MKCTLAQIGGAEIIRDGWQNCSLDFECRAQCMCSSSLSSFYMMSLTCRFPQQPWEYTLLCVTSKNYLMLLWMFYQVIICWPEITSIGGVLTTWAWYARLHENKLEHEASNRPRNQTKKTNVVCAPAQAAVAQLDGKPPEWLYKQETKLQITLVGKLWSHNKQPIKPRLQCLIYM